LHSKTNILTQDMLLRCIYYVSHRVTRHHFIIGERILLVESPTSPFIYMETMLHVFQN